MAQCTRSLLLHWIGICAGNYGRYTYFWGTFFETFERSDVQKEVIVAGRATVERVCAGFAILGTRHALTFVKN